MRQNFQWKMFAKNVWRQLWLFLFKNWSWWTVWKIELLREIFSSMLSVNITHWAPKWERLSCYCWRLSRMNRRDKWCELRSNCRIRSAFRRRNFEGTYRYSLMRCTDYTLKNRLSSSFRTIFVCCKILKALRLNWSLLRNGKAFVLRYVHLIDRHNTGNNIIN